MHKNIVLWDLICYIIFPLIIWHGSREYIGDYYAMLISTVPGFIYSIIRFVILKKVNFLGIYLIVTLAIGTLIDVLAGSAMQMLWNSVIYSYALSFLLLISIAINKPLYLLFAVDIMELRGRNREILKQEFYQKKVLFIFKLITFGFAFQGILLASIKVWLIMNYGVEAFDKGLVLRQVLSWTISAVLIYGFVHIGKLLNYKSNAELERESQEAEGGRI
ncbi:membrane protein [Jeotgalibacillus malaysiensis]|uniref:Membrane protein n=1 Tax=Jeotgalibacillus malaysiensis TaxID=1508404 RepID=A0A0B5AJX5_9BACL|nr:VC0807 family protein [Jeotgalibacillus malaysiensis]AJD90311.1 membrane protein [Jeotgalibacillus malaysiensis]